MWAPSSKALELTGGPTPAPGGPLRTVGLQVVGERCVGGVRLSYICPQVPGPGPRAPLPVPEPSPVGKLPAE